jgi:Flp pilus assembly protein TadG
MALSDIARTLLRDERGTSAVMLVILMTALIGTTALAISAGSWFTERRGFQTAADAAALAGAYDLRNGVTATLAADATAEAVANGASSPANVTINRPPVYGSFAGNSNAVEAIVSGSSGLNLTGAAQTIAARATAKGITNVAVCGIALSPNGVSQCSDAQTDAGICLQGLGRLQLGPSCAHPDCGVVSDATGSTDSIHIRSSSDLCADSIYAVGGVNFSGASQLPRGVIPITGAPAFPDPYAGSGGYEQQLQSWIGQHPLNCTSISKTASTIGPPSAPYNCYDVFQQSAQAAITLTAGTYIITDPNPSVGAISGTGVTLVFAQGPDGNWGSMSGLTFGSISAPSAGASYTNPSLTMPGVVLFRDNAAPAETVTVTNSAGGFIDGIIYAATDELHFAGNAETNGCLIIVVGSIALQGQSTLDDYGCSSAYGVQAPVINTVALAE